MATHARSIEDVRPQADAAPAIDRRAALGSLAAGALLAVPRLAKAGEHPDAELFALVRKAKELEVQYEAAERAVDAAYERFVEPSPPEALIGREGDAELLTRTKRQGFVSGRVLSSDEIEAAKASRKTWTQLTTLVDWRGTDQALDDWLALIQRAVDIEAAAGQHDRAVEAAKIAIGLPEAEAALERITNEQVSTWRSLALMPARTRDGVLAKLEVIAPILGEDFDRDACERDWGASAGTVAASAAADLAALKTWEA